MKKRALFGLGAILVVVIVLGGFTVWSINNSVNSRDPISLSERFYVSAVDRNVLDMGQQYRDKIDAEFGPQDWIAVDTETYAGTYLNCTVNGENGKTFNRSLGDTHGLTVEDYPRIQQIVTEITAQHGWTIVADRTDTYSLTTYYYHPNDKGWFHLGMNKDTGGMGLVFYGSCYQIG